MRTGLCGLALAGVLFAVSRDAFAQTAQACDRACLLGIADAYFAALVAHDPAKAPMAPNAKFTEQAQVLKVGDGLVEDDDRGADDVQDPGARSGLRTDRRHRHDQGERAGAGGVDAGRPARAAGSSTRCSSRCG